MVVVAVVVAVNIGAACVLQAFWVHNYFSYDCLNSGVLASRQQQQIALLLSASVNLRTALHFLPLGQAGIARRCFRSFLRFILRRFKVIIKGKLLSNFNRIM